MNAGISAVVVFACGFAGSELLHIWREAAEKRATAPRPFVQVLDDVEHAIPQLVGSGVYWFDGSLEDARQIRDIIEALQPSLSVSVMKIEGLPDVAVINAQHSIFGNGGMLLREVEKKLTTIAPANN